MAKKKEKSLEEVFRQIRKVLGGSELELAVWMAVAKIPAGEVRTYSEVAAAAGFPRAVRAVASAVGRNPLPIVIPCHRVIRKNGELGEYAFGADLKRWLLEEEGFVLAKAKI